jgi:hypothetical protein
MKHIKIIFIILPITMLSCFSGLEKSFLVKEIGYVGGNFTENYIAEEDTILDHVFPESDTSKLIEIEKLISGDSSYIMMNDSLIFRKIRYSINDETMCCEDDTTKYFVEEINKKKYLLLLKYSGVHLYELDEKSNIKIRKRTEINVPSWGVEYGSTIGENAFKDSISYIKDYFGTFIDKTKYSIYLNNRELELNTIRFPSKTERVVSKITKNMSQLEVEDFLKFMKIKYPSIALSEDNLTLNGEIEKENRKVFRFAYDGMDIVIFENNLKGEYSNNDWDNKKYTFVYTDVYKLAKNLLGRKGLDYEVVQFSKTLRTDIK